MVLDGCSVTTIGKRNVLYVSLLIRIGSCCQFPKPTAVNSQSGLSEQLPVGLISAVGADFLSPICNVLQATLANCGFLQPTVTRIAEDYGRANRYISMATAAVGFGK
jgi:hypothetical protein